MPKANIRGERRSLAKFWSPKYWPTWVLLGFMKFVTYLPFPFQIKIGKFVEPAGGFNVIATANTKGKGSDDGRFIGTNVLNEAFLERFPVTFEQEYPSPNIENKILGGIAAKLGVTDTDFCKRLVDWGDIIRKTFYDGGIDEII